MDFKKDPKIQAAELTLYFLSQTLDLQRAQDCAKFYIDGLIAFGDYNLLGWLDADIMAYLNDVKNSINFTNG